MTHSHVFATAMPVDERMAKAIADPLMVIVFGRDGQTLTWHADELTAGVAGLAVAELATLLCVQHPATAAEDAAYRGVTK